MTMTIIISNANKTPSKNFSQIKFESYVAFEAFGQSDEEPWPDHQTHNDKDNYKDI